MASKKTRSAAAGGVEELATRVLALKAKGSKIDLVERAIVTAALDQCEGNVSAAARLVGIDRKAMERRIASYNIK